MAFALRFVITVATALATSASWPATYSITALETPANADSYAVAINNRGEVVGKVDDRAVLWHNGKKIDLGTFGYEASLAADINDRGQVVGLAYNDPPTRDSSKAFVWGDGKVIDIGLYKGRMVSVSSINDKGQVVGDADAIVGLLWESKRGMRDLGHLGEGEDLTIPRSINNKGQIVGESRATAFIWEAGKMGELPTLPEMQASRAWAINDSGQAVGCSYNLGAVEKKPAKLACLWEKGKVIELGALAGEWSDAFGINNKKRVVGTSGVSGADLSRAAGHAFLWENGKMTDLNTLIPSDSGWVLREARAINDAGLIVGNGDYKGRIRAFLLTPRS